MTDPNERLIQARKMAGFSTAQEAADSLGVKYPTYAGHENGTTGMRAPVAEKYAKKFRVSIDWLLTGKGKGPSPETITAETPIEQAKKQLEEAAATASKLGVPSIVIAEWLVDALGEAHFDIARQEAIEGLSKIQPARSSAR
jgi:transcriptional regulator with XRE-family HTH domain